MIAEGKEKLWEAVELLDRYSMIDLKEGVANIHRLVQKVTELNLQKEDREGEVLRKAPDLINSDDIEISHIVSIWKCASKYSKLIDDFYFLPIYSEQKYTPLHLLAESGEYEAVEILLIHIEERYTSRLSKGC